MAGFGMVFGLIGSGLSAMGLMAQAQGQAELLRDQAALKEAEARNLRIKGQQEHAVASVRAEREWEKGKRLTNEQIARFASSGGGVDGSAGGTVVRSVERGLHNSGLVAWEGEQKKRGFFDQAAIGDYSAGRLREAASRTESNSWMGAASSLLTGVSRIGGSFGGTSTASNLHYGSTDTSSSSWWS